MTIKEANSPFDDGITRLMKEKGLKQKYVADKAGYTTQEFSDMMNGRKIIKLCDIPRIAVVLGVNVDDIYSAGKEKEVV